MNSGTVPHRALRIDYIDGLRALAVLAVLFHHFAKHLDPGMPQWILLEGAHGVDLFFVLSGFCLAFPTLVKLRAGAPVRFDVVDFGTKRLVRLLPPFYIAAAVLLMIAVVPHLITHHALPPADRVPDWGSIVAQFLFLDGHATLINSSFWTLMVEFRWYFAFPVLLWLWVRSPRAFVGVGVASIVLFHLTRARGLDFGTLPGFMLGIVAADVYVNGPHAAGWRRALSRWAVLLIVPAVALGVATQGSATIPGLDGTDVAYPYQPTILGWQLACFALVVFAGANRHVQRLFSLRALVATGVASYGIYLVHEPIINVLAARFPSVPGEFGAALVGLAAGFGFWALFERPFTTGGLRAPLLTWVKPRLERVFAFAGVGRAIQIGTALQPAAVPESVPARGAVYPSRSAVAAPIA